jgi:hypothetical protein
MEFEQSWETEKKKKKKKRPDLSFAAFILVNWLL